MCSRLIQIFVILFIVDSIHNFEECKNSTKASRSTKKRRLLSDVNEYLTSDLNDEEQLLDPWAFFKNYELGEYTEGDLRIPKEGNRRTFLKKAKFWREGIVPFFVNGIIKNDTHALTVLLNAMRTISIATNNCIQFIPIDMEQIHQYPQLSFLNITGDEQGCFADIGQSNYENLQSQINLNINQCFLLPGNSLHELLHILGQTHEHMRPDRDHFIRIVWDNVAPGSQSNFEILDFSEVENYNLPYDYESVTHYSRTAFTNDPALATIVPLNKTATIGQRTHLSTIDKQKLNIQYACPKGRKRYTFADILTLYNITTDNTTTRHDIKQKVPSNTTDTDDKSSKNSNKLLLRPIIPPSLLFPFVKPIDNTKFEPNYESFNIQPIKYETRLPYILNPTFASILEKLINSNDPYISITINGIPYKPNGRFPQSYIGYKNQYTYPTISQIYNPYRSTISTESPNEKYLINNGPRDTIVKLNSIFYNQPSNNMPFNLNPNNQPSLLKQSNVNYFPFGYGIRTNPYESILYKTPTLNYIYPKTNPYESLFFKSPTYSYNHPKPNPYELHLKSAFNYKPSYKSPYNDPIPGRNPRLTLEDKNPNYENVLLKLSTLEQPIQTKRKPNNKTDGCPGEIKSSNRKTTYNLNSITTNSNPFIDPNNEDISPNFFQTIIKLLNPVRTNDNFMGNPELKENTNPNGFILNKSPYPSANLFKNELPSPNENPEIPNIINPYEIKPMYLGRRPIIQNNHPSLNGNINPNQLINNEYPATFEFPEEDILIETEPSNLNKIPFDIKSQISYLYPETGLNTDGIETPYEPLLLKSPDLSTPLFLEKEYPQTNNDIEDFLNELKIMRDRSTDKNMNEIVTDFLKNGIPSRNKQQINTGPSTRKDIYGIMKIYQIIKKDYPSTDKDLNDIRNMYKIIKHGYPSPGKDINDIIKMYKIITNGYPSPDKDFNDILKIYKIIQNGYHPLGKNNNGIETNPEQSLLLNWPRLNIPNEFPKNLTPLANNKLSKSYNSTLFPNFNTLPSTDGPITKNSDSLTDSIIFNPYEYTKPKLNNIPLDSNPTDKSEYSTTEKITKYYIIKPQETKSPKIKVTTTRYYSNIAQPSDFQSSPHKSKSPSLTYTPEYTNDPKTNSDQSKSPTLSHTSKEPKNLKTNPSELRSTLLSLNNPGDYFTRVKTVGPSTNNNNLKMNPHKYESPTLTNTPEYYNKLLSVSPSTDNNGFQINPYNNELLSDPSLIPNNILVYYNPHIKDINSPIIIDDTATNSFISKAPLTDFNLIIKTLSPSTENNGFISNPSESISPTLTNIPNSYDPIIKNVGSLMNNNGFRTYPYKSKSSTVIYTLPPNYMSLIKTIYPSTNNGDFNPQKSHLSTVIQNKPTTKIVQTSKTNDFEQNPCKSSSDQKQNPKFLNPLLDSSKNIIRTTPSTVSTNYQFIISLPAKHNVNFQNPYKTNHGFPLNNDDINSNQEQLHLRAPATYYATTQLENVKHSLPTTSWLDLYISLCDKAKKDIRDLPAPYYAPS